MLFSTAVVKFRRLLLLLYSYWCFIPSALISFLQVTWLLEKSVMIFGLINEVVCALLEAYFSYFVDTLCGWDLPFFPRSLTDASSMFEVVFTSFNGDCSSA